MSRRRAFGATLGLLVLTACGEAVPQIGVRDVWSRPTIAAGRDAPAPPTGPGVVYARLVNRGGAPDRLTAVRSVICDSVEIHRTTLIDDRMRMAPVEGGVEVPAGGAAAMQPGGYHLMLFGLHRHLRAGDRFEIEFEFEHSGRVTATAEVRPP